MVLNHHPAITQSAVTDIEVKPDLRVIMAFYTAPQRVDDAALDAYVSDSLAAYKRPRAYIHVDALPTGANGKLLRRKLRPIYEALNGQA
jgi:acyl-coenzyme A synthetase/AMP-(fatty) acid ligase